MPLVIRAPAGSGTGAAAQHSQSLEAWFAHVPGLKVVMPATPADAMGLLRAAVAAPNPVLVLEHKLLYKERGPVPPGHHVPLGKAAVRRGVDLTIVATSVTVGRSLAAAEGLAAEGIEVTVAETPIRMPKLSMTMEEGEYACWLVATGDTVTRGMPVAVVLTDKVDMEIESEVEGTVTRLTAQEGDVVPVGKPLGYVDSRDDGGLGDLDELLS